MLSLSYYLHERAEESRHNETMGLLTAILGSVFMVGGIIQTLVTVEKPQWFLVFPYQLGASPYDFLGLAFTLLGVTVFLGGIVLGVYFGAQRSWYSNALRESYRFEEEKLKANKNGQKVVSRTLPISETETREESSVTDIRASEQESPPAPPAPA
jgi:hypothetical protein